MKSAELLPPSLADLEQMAQAAFATLPAELKKPLGDVLIRIEEFPDEETEKAMELESPSKTHASHLVLKSHPLRINLIIFRVVL